MATSTVTFLVISDTHDMTLTNHLSRAFRQSSAVSADVILHCGDITENGGIESYRKAVAMLDSLNVELKLIIAGNHDIDLDPLFWVTQGGCMEDHDAVMRYMTSKDLTDRGIHYLQEGTYTFTLRSGARFKIYASPYTPKYGESAFQYASGEDRYNTETPPAYASNVSSSVSVIPNDVDIVMTHGPPKYVLDYTPDGGAGGCEHLRRAICQSKPLLHCFGHIHGGYGAQRVAWKGAGDESVEDECENREDDMIMLAKDFVGTNEARKRGYATLSPAMEEQLVKGRQTLMLNAAIENSAGEPENAPWLVKLQLRCTEQLEQGSPCMKRGCEEEDSRHAKRLRAD